MRTASADVDYHTRRPADLRTSCKSPRSFRSSGKAPPFLEVWPFCNPEGSGVLQFCTPKGLHRSAQGCCTRLPWETDDLRRPTPTGWWLSEGHNPFRVATQFAVGPKVAEYSNLGLWDATPFGVASTPTEVGLHALAMLQTFSLQTFNSYGVGASYPAYTTNIELLRSSGARSVVTQPSEITASRPGIKLNRPCWASTPELIAFHCDCKVTMRVFRCDP